MAEQVLIQFRADKELKQEVADIYEQLGMDLPTAFRMFMVRSRIVRGLPFEVPDFYILPNPTLRSDVQAIPRFQECGYEPDEACHPVVPHSSPKIYTPEILLSLISVSSRFLTAA